MLQKYFHNSPLLVFPVVAMVVFMALFAVVVIRVILAKKNSEKGSLYNKLAQLPLDESISTGRGSNV